MNATNLPEPTPPEPDPLPHMVPPSYPPTPTLEPETAPEPEQPVPEPEPEPETQPAVAVSVVPRSPPESEGLAGTLEAHLSAGQPAQTYPPPGATPVPSPLLNGTTRFYKKVSVNFPLYVDKARVQFEVLDEQYGVLRTTDHRTIEVLDGFAKAKKGGVVAINEETYQQLKKKFPFKPSVPRFQQGREKLRVWNNKPRKLNPSVSADRAAVAGDVRRAPKAPLPVPKDAGDVAESGNPATFSPNLRPKSGIPKTPASGKFRAEYMPPIPPKQ